MKKEDIDRLLSDENNEAVESHKEIVSIQKDKSNVLRTGYDWLDNSLVGGLNNKLLAEGSRPGNGKTYKCSELINNLLNKEINPFPVNILRLNLEVPTLTLLVRELSKALNKKPSEIFAKPYTDEEKPIVTKVVSAFKDSRIKNVSKTLKGEDFRYLILKFTTEIDALDEAYNKEQTKDMSDEELEKYVPRRTKKVTLLDHLNIYPDKQTIDEILLICNDLKLQDKNLSFIIFFQLSRTVEELWREGKDRKVNPRNVLPNSTFIHQSDVLQQVADLVVGMTIPQIYDLETFASVHKERDSHLKEHFTDDNGDTDWVKLKGRNRIYYNIIKNRMTDDFDDPRLFCSVLNPQYEEKANKIMKENLSPFGKTNALPIFSTPVFEQNTTAEIIPTSYADLSKVFDSQTVKGEDDSDSPF